MKNLFFRFRASRELERHLKENAAQGKPLCVTDDMVFKAMLSSDNEDSREALRSLLCACTRREVVNVHVLNSELLPAHLGAKSPRLDVKVTFNDGETANLEMQMGKSEDNIRDRSSYYTAMLLAGQSEKGQLYKEIKRVYQIFFLNFIMFPQSNKLPRRYRYMEEVEHDFLSESSEIIFYELPKLEKRLKDFYEGRAGTESLSEEEKWCIFIGYRHEEQASPLIEELCRKEEGIMHAEKSLNKISRNYLKYLKKMDEAKDRIDLHYKLKGAHERGVEQGRAEEREKASNDKLQTALNFKNMSIPIEQIAKGTGLSMDEIAKL